MSDPISPADTLRVAVDEYRFQVRLNADRVNYWYTLNVAMLVAGAALTHLQDATWVPVAVFTLTAVTALLCAAGVHTQHSYYRAARDRAMAAAAAAGVPDVLRTTPGMRAETGVRFRVVVIVELIFCLLGLAALVAAVGLATA